MRTSATILSAAALAGIAAASPAPQQIDFEAIINAPSLTLTGPPLTVATQIVTVSTAAIIQSVTAEVTTVATAAITGAAASAAANLAPVASAGSKRSLEERSTSNNTLMSQLLALLGLHLSNGGSTTTSSSTTSSSSIKISSTSTSTSSLATSVAPVPIVKAVTTSTISSSSSSSTSSFFTSLSLSSTTTTNGLAQSASSTTSSSTACPTTPENGTYCGFINPEDPCAPQPDGYGPAIVPDTVQNFMTNSTLQTLASSLPSTVPSVNNTQYVQTFSNYNASTSANSYLGLYTLQNYSAPACAALCDSTTSCTAFNIYIERDPSQNPTMNDSTAATVWGYWCPNPTSITNFKCTLWGSDLDNTTATNAGGWREQFNVVIVGSAGYDKTNVTVPAVVTSFNVPTNNSGAAINGGSYYMGSKFFPGPYNPTVCGSYATAQTAQNKAAAVAAGQHSYTPCNMFNSYHIHRNGVPLGTYCSLYDTPLSSSWATYTGSWSGNNYYSCRNSWSYSLSAQDPGKC